jgi:hypothetical protein
VLQLILATTRIDQIKVQNVLIGEIKVVENQELFAIVEKKGEHFPMLGQLHLTKMSQ